MSSARLIAGVFALGAAMLTTSGAEAALTIGGGVTQNVVCVGNACSATRPVAVLNATQLATMLGLSDVKVSSGSSTKDIIVHTAFSWTSNHRLTLDSYRSITVDYAVTVSGPGAVTLTTNDGATGGTFATQFPGRIDFWDLSSSLIINGASYTLVGDIATLASEATANAHGHYALAKNYDAGADGIYTSSPVAAGVKGPFEGLGHVISHLAIHASHASANIGLFGCVCDGGQVENIGLTEVDIRAGFRSYVGTLTGWSDGAITNVFAKGRVHGGNDSFVGGLVGYSATNAPSADDYVGAVVSSYTTGTVIGDGTAMVGGLVGFSNYGSKISNSHSAARVIAATDAGGLVGLLEGSLTNSWATGSVTAGDNGNAGGLVGFYFNDLLSNSDLENCYATGNVTGGQSTNAGGLIGELFHNNGETLVPTTDSYAAGQPVAGTGSYVGGFVGAVVNGGSFGNTYWDTDSSGIANPSQGAGNVPNHAGITGLSDTPLTSGLPAGFDPTVWAEKAGINGGRPYLIANPPSP